MKQITVTEWLALLDSIKADIATRWPSVEVEVGVASVAARYGRWRVDVYVDSGRAFAMADVGTGWPQLVEDLHFFVHGRIQHLTVLPPTEAEVSLLREREPKPATAEEVEAILRGLKDSTSR